MKINLLRLIQNIFHKDSRVFDGKKYETREERMIQYKIWKARTFGGETMNRINYKNKEHGKLWNERNYDTVAHYSRHPDRRVA